MQMQSAPSLKFESIEIRQHIFLLHIAITMEEML